VRQAVAAHVPRRGSLAVAEGRHAGCYDVLILDRDGACRAVAKVVTGVEHEARLAREAAALESIARLLPPPLSAPRLLAHEPRTLVLEALPWTPRRRPWLLPEEVAFALGLFFRAGDDGEGSGAAHGNCTPWNLLQSPPVWALVDWEQASASGAPFQDLCHFVVQAHARLHRPSEQAVVDGFVRRTGAVGRAVAAYAEGADRPPDDAATFLRAYLQASERVELAVRRRLLDLLGR
jgi:hypothetical protein